VVPYERGAWVSVMVFRFKLGILFFFLEITELHGRLLKVDDPTLKKKG